MDALEDGVTSNALIKEVLEPSLGSATCVAAALASRVREATAKRSGRGIDSAIERAPQLAGAPTSAGTPPEGISNGRS